MFTTLEGDMIGALSILCLEYCNFDRDGDRFGWVFFFLGRRRRRAACCSSGARGRVCGFSSPRWLAAAFCCPTKTLVAGAEEPDPSARAGTLLALSHQAQREKKVTKKAPIPLLSVRKAMQATATHASDEHRWAFLRPYCCCCAVAAVARS